MRFLMDDADIPDTNLAETQKSLQEIRDLPATLLKTRGMERQFPRHSLGREGGPEVPLTDFFLTYIYE